MRFIYQLLLALILFNVMLVLFSPYFPGTSEIKGEGNDAIYELRNTEQGSYEGVSSVTGILTTMFLNWQTLSIMGSILLIGGILAKISGASINFTLLLGISILIAVLMAVWNTAITTVSNLNPENNLEIATLFIIINICIGIILVFTVVEMLVGQQGVEQ